MASRKGFGDKQKNQVSFPKWFSLIEESLDRCTVGQKRKYMKLLKRSWEGREPDSRIMFLFDFPDFKCGVAFYKEFNEELKRFFPNIGAMIEQNHPIGGEGRMIILLAVPPDIVRSFSVPYSKE